MSHAHAIGQTLPRRALLTIALSCAFALGTHAAEPRIPSAQEIIERLTRQPTEEELRSRAVTVEGERPRAAAKSPRSIDLDVNFEFASAALTPDARIILDNLGKALTDPALREARIHIGGHTDAKGPREYNLRLSRQRAQSVANYLARVHAVDAKRLTIEGFGFDRLLDQENPESGVNRRVQITNLGS